MALKGNLMAVEQSLPIPPAPSPWEVRLLSISMDFPILGIS